MLYPVSMGEDEGEEGALKEGGVVGVKGGGEERGGSNMGVESLASTLSSVEMGSEGWGIEGGTRDGT